MTQHCVRSPDDEVSSILNAQAEVDVVQADGKVDGIQATDFFEHVPAAHQACTGNRAQALRACRPWELSYLRLIDFRIIGGAGALPAR
jgi:hypothetical protein